MKQNRNVVRLNESQLKQMISESVKNVLNEIGNRSPKASDKQLAYIENLLNTNYRDINNCIKHMRNVYSQKKDKIDVSIASEMIKYLKDTISYEEQVYGDIFGDTHNYRGRGYSGSTQDLHNKGEQICSMLEKL